MDSSTSQRHLIILGCGFMGTAILQGLLEKPDQQCQWRYTAVVRTESSLKRLQKQFDGHDGVTTRTADGGLVQAIADADMVMLGCAPGDLDSLLGTTEFIKALETRPEGAKRQDEPGAKFHIVSLLAGVSTRQLSSTLEGHGVSAHVDNLDIARVIPSIGAKIGDSVTLLAESESLSERGQQETHRLFARVGAVLPVQERLMNDATAIGAACHALNIIALDAITDASVAEGMDRPAAVMLAAETLRSSANLFCAGGMTSEELKQAMSTPKGITINSVLQLQRSSVSAGIADAVRAAVRYARSM